jgi:voltage-gated sodium channel
MTLESWSMGIVRPIMEKHPLAWAFFIPFILITTFTLLNLMVAVMVNAMDSETPRNEEDYMTKKDKDDLIEELKLVKKELRLLSTPSSSTRSKKRRPFSESSH